MYPLLVATKSQSTSRRTAAYAVLEQIRQHNATLVDQVWEGGEDDAGDAGRHPSVVEAREGMISPRGQAPWLSDLSGVSFGGIQATCTKLTSTDPLPAPCRCFILFRRLSSCRMN